MTFCSLYIIVILILTLIYFIIVIPAMIFCSFIILITALTLCSFIIVIAAMSFCFLLLIAIPALTLIYFIIDIPACHFDLCYYCDFWLMLLLWFYPCHSALFYDLKAFSAPLYFQNLFFVTYLIQLTNRHTYLKHSRLTELHLCSFWLDTPPGEVINLFIVVFILSCPHQVCRRSLSSLRLSFS